MLHGICKDTENEFTAKNHSIVIRIDLDPTWNRIPVQAHGEFGWIAGLKPCTFMDDRTAEELVDDVLERKQAIKLGHLDIVNLSPTRTSHLRAEELLEPVTVIGVLRVSHARQRVNRAQQEQYGAVLTAEMI